MPVVAVVTTVAVWPTMRPLTEGTGAGAMLPAAMVTPADVWVEGRKPEPVPVTATEITWPASATVGT